MAATWPSRPQVPNDIVRQDFFCLEGTEYEDISELEPRSAERLCTFILFTDTAHVVLGR